MRDLECDPSTLAGPLDPRVVAKLERLYPLDPAFLTCMDTCHGGVPNIGKFPVGAKQNSKVGVFLTLLDDKSVLLPPSRPHFDDPSWDERVMDSIWYVGECEHVTKRALFRGLLPFAAVMKDMHLDRAYVDLLCFDYRQAPSIPPVVYWRASAALDAYLQWDELPFNKQYLEDGSSDFSTIRWNKFLLPVAPSFSAFVELLSPVK